MAAKKKPTKPPPSDAVLAKVRKLLALAADPAASEEERRSAAVVAARLMREHGISVGEPATAPPAAAVPPLEPGDVHFVVANARELAAAFAGPDGLVSSLRSMVALFSPPPPPPRPRATKKRR